MQLLQASAHFERRNEKVEQPIILVIEDHPATRTVLACMLDLQGYQSVCVANGLEALKWIEDALTARKYPAVILLDLFMPVMDGTRFLAGLRARWQAPVPFPFILLLTADQGNHDDLICTDILQKPFHMRDLLGKLRMMISKEHDRSYRGIASGGRNEASK